MHDRKILILCEGGRQYVLSPIKHNGNKKLPHRTRMRKMYTNFWITSQQIQMKWSDFTLQMWFYTQIPIRHIWLIQKCAVALWGVFLRDHTFKMKKRAFEWPYTCKLKIFKCRFSCRSRNRRMFRNRKKFHNPTEHIRINGPSTACCTSDGFQPKTSHFSTRHLVGVNYKGLSQLSQPISPLFSYLNSVRHNLVIWFCREQKIDIKLRTQKKKLKVFSLWFFSFFQ